MKQEKLTKFIKTEDADRKWYLVDAKDQVLGRLASGVARVIRGKHKPIFTPNTDTGDFVVIVNADKVKVTGKREMLKDYKWHSGYPGGQKVTAFQDKQDLVLPSCFFSNLQQFYIWEEPKNLRIGICVNDFNTLTQRAKSLSESKL